MTRIAVLLPAWNGERFVADQIDSILADLPADGFLRVRDDRSDDRTAEIVSGFAARDPRVELVRGDERIGVVRSVEILLEGVEADAVFLADQDDLWRPGKTARCLEALATTDLVVHDASRIDAEGRPLEGTLFSRRGAGGGFLANVWRNRFTGCCMAFRSDLLRRALPFPERVPMHDQWLGLVALRRGRVAWIPDVLVDYRVHGGNATATGSGASKAGAWRRIRWRLQAVRSLMR